MPFPPVVTFGRGNEAFRPGNDGAEPVRVLVRTSAKPCDRPVPRSLVPETLFAQVALRFRLLGDPTRLQILDHLHEHGEAPVQALVEATGQSQPNVSKHLRRLHEAGVVARRHEGPFVHYRIDDPTIASLCLLVCGHLRGD